MACVEDCALNSAGPHLQFMVLPVRKVQGLHLADVRNVAVDPGTVQTDEDPQGAGAPTRIFREGGEKDKLERCTAG